jgi:hypothetical protein
MSLLGISFDAKGLVPWLLAATLVGAGLAGIRWLSPRVRAAWGMALGGKGTQQVPSATAEAVA